MDYSELIETVRTEHDHQPSVEDQVRVIAIVAHNGFAESQSLSQADIEAHAEDDDVEFDCADARPALDNLVDIGILQRSNPGGDRTYVISERLDDIVNGEFEETLRTDREALIEHIKDDDPPEEPEDVAVADGGVTVRQVVAEALEVVSEGVEARLRAGDATDQREPLNTAVDAIADDEDIVKRDTYGKILLRKSGYQYRFSESARAVITSEGDKYDQTHSEMPSGNNQDSRRQH
ncbi:hypothetical protein [Haloarcula sebkhae]|uniref:Uncharacterized protein n=2 Tax=Haloarcula sebkhae TaxID=932660 RepID=A0ACC6VNC8_9EURY|nr:hypothetical protein [Haloarcula sebkhae]GGK83368.1 hypothetical protein GCM10009067_39520 [Haloarcula sebkhae]